MTTKDFSDAMGNLDPKYVEEAQSYKPTKKKQLLRMIPAVGAAALILIVLLCIPSSPRLPTDGMEVVRESVDRAVYTTLSELESSCDIIVVGSFVGEAEQQLTPESGLYLSNAVTRREIRVSEVLSGAEVSAGDHLTISQRYGVIGEQNKLVSFSGLTPMNKGDQWIFFLSYDEENSTYWCKGDSDGRYPLPDGEAGEIYRKASAIISERDEWLASECGQFTGEMPEGSYMAMSQEGTLYLVPEDKAEIFLSYEIPLTEIRDGISPELFGVWDTQLINLPLYCSTIGKYLPQ